MVQQGLGLICRAAARSKNIRAFSQPANRADFTTPCTGWRLYKPPGRSVAQCMRYRSPRSSTWTAEGHLDIRPSAAPPSSPTLLLTLLRPLSSTSTSLPLTMNHRNHPTPSPPLASSQPWHSSPAARPPSTRQAWSNARANHWAHGRPVHHHRPARRNRQPHQLHRQHPRRRQYRCYVYG